MHLCKAAVDVMLDTVAQWVEAREMTRNVQQVYSLANALILKLIDTNVLSRFLFL